MGKQHNRRIFAGFYKRYDNKYIYVVAVVPDVDTGSQVVIFHEGIDACECKYYSMTKQSFCEMVEVDGEWVDKFTRQPQIRITDTHIQNLIDGGFSGPVRKKTPKDEDLAFLNDCLKTVLKSYSAYFRERYIEGKSVRKYAEAHEMNRGSVDHLNRKFIAELAAALKARDDADGVCRLPKK